MTIKTNRDGVFMMICFFFLVRLSYNDSVVFKFNKVFYAQIQTLFSKNVYIRSKKVVQMTKNNSPVSFGLPE